jgi:hypothetical protein
MGSCHLCTQWRPYLARAASACLVVVGSVCARLAGVCAGRVHGSLTQPVWSHLLRNALHGVPAAAQC